jgi:hypothetical protein
MSHSRTCCLVERLFCCSKVIISEFSMTEMNYGTNRPAVSMTTAVVAPFDRVRWGPILAGLFAALSLLTLLSVLGLAIGLTAWDPGDDERRFSTGAGIWSIISALIAFFFGGWLAARSAAAVGERNGVLNGAMVWAVAIPLIIFIVGGGAASLADAAVNGAGTRVVYLDRGERGGDFTDRAQLSSARVGDVATGGAATGGATGGTTADNTSTPGSAANVNMPESKDEARTLAKGAWWTLLSLVLGLAAAAGGGYSGARSYDDRYDRDDRRYGTTTTGTTGTTDTGTTNTGTTHTP